MTFLLKQSTVRFSVPCVGSLKTQSSGHVEVPFIGHECFSVKCGMSQFSCLDAHIPKAPALGWHLHTPFSTCWTQDTPTGRGQEKGLGFQVHLQCFIFYLKQVPSQLFL